MQQLSEVADVLDLLQGFELESGVVVAITLSVSMEKGSPSLSIAAVANWGTGLKPEVKKSASVSSNTSVMNLRNLKDAVTHVLYMLDFALVLEKSDPAENK